MGVHTHRLRFGVSEPQHGLHLRGHTVGAAGGRRGGVARRRGPGGVRSAEAGVRDRGGANCGHAEGRGRRGGGGGGGGCRVGQLLRPPDPMPLLVSVGFRFTFGGGRGGPGFLAVGRRGGAAGLPRPRLAAAARARGLRRRRCAGGDLAQFEPGLGEQVAEPLRERGREPALLGGCRCRLRSLRSGWAAAGLQSARRHSSLRPALPGRRRRRSLRLSLRLLQLGLVVSYQRLN